MSAVNTVLPDEFDTTIGISTSPSLTIDGSNLLTAVIVPVALATYCTVMVLGIQRIEFGTIESNAKPPVISAIEQSAPALIVPIWFRTLRRSCIWVSQ